MQLYTYTTIYTHMYVCLFGFWPPWSALGTTIINFVNLSPNWKLTCIHSCLGLSGCKYRCCSPDNPQLNFKLTNIRAAAPFAVIQLTLVCVRECVLCCIFPSFLLLLFFSLSNGLPILGNTVQKLYSIKNCIYYMQFPPQR